MAAGERLDEAVQLARALCRQGRELQARRPALGALLERGDVVGLQLEPHHLVEERGRLRLGEAQVVGADLQQLPRARSRASGSGGSARVVIARVTCGGRLSSRKVTASWTSARVDDVVVVQREHGRPGQGVEVVDEAGQHVLRAGGPVALEQRRRVRAQARVGQPGRPRRGGLRKRRTSASPASSESQATRALPAESHWVRSVVLPKPAGAATSTSRGLTPGPRPAGPSAGSASRAGVAAAARAACRAAQPCPSA